MTKSIITAVLCASLGACSKEDERPQIDLLLTEEKAVTNSFSHIKCQEGILIFRSVGHFVQTIDQLDERDQQHNEQFVRKYTGLSANDIVELDGKELDSLSTHLSDIAEKVKFSEDAVFRSFERKFDYHSLRSQIEYEMSAFLSNPDPDWNSCPEYHPIQSASDRTVFNSEGLLKIGSTIYKITNYGRVIESVNGDSRLSNLMDLTDLIPDVTATSIHFQNRVLTRYPASLNSAAVCESSKSATFPPVSYNGGVNQYTGLLANRNFNFFAFVVSSTYNFEWNGNTWERANAFLQTQNWGETADTTIGLSCGTPKIHQTQLKVHFGKRLVSRHLTNVGTSKTISTQPWWLHSSHVANSSGHLFHLTW